MTSHQICKRCFTLIELLICLTLVIALGSVLTVRARSMIDRYKFDKGMEKLVRQLNLTKQLALTSDNDITLKLKLEGGKLRCIRLSPIDSTVWDSFSISFSLEPISHFCLDNKEQQEWDCHFMANGWLKETGMIHLSYNHKHHCLIDLTETPFFKRLSNPPEKACHR